MKRILALIILFSLVQAPYLLSMETNVVPSTLSSANKATMTSQARILEKADAVSRAQDELEALTLGVAHVNNQQSVKASSNQSSMEYTDGQSGPLRFINTPRAESPAPYKAPLSLNDFILLPLADSYSQQLAHLATYCHLENIECCQAVAATAAYLVTCISQLDAKKRNPNTERDLQAALYSCAALGQKWESPAPQEISAILGKLVRTISDDSFASAKTIAQAVLGLRKEFNTYENSISSATQLSDKRFFTTPLADSDNASSLCSELEELILTIDEQFPFLLKFENLSVVDLKEDPLTLHLFEQRVIRFAAACKEKEDCAIGDLLKLLAQNKVLLEFYKQEESSSNEHKAQKSSSSADNNNNDDGKDELWKGAQRKSSQLARELHPLVKQIEPHALKEETSIHIFLDYCGLPCEHIIIALLRKRFIQQVEKLVDECEALPEIGDEPELLQRMLTVCSELNCVFNKLQQTYDGSRTQLLPTRELLANAFIKLIAKTPQLSATVLNRIPVILATRELFHVPLLCFLVENYRPKEAWGHELWRALIVKAAATVSAIEHASDQDFIESIDPQELAQLAKNAEKMRFQHQLFNQQKEHKVSTLKKELEGISQAVVALTLKEPQLVDSTALLVKELHHNKQVLLMLAKNMIEQGVDKSTANDRRLVVSELTSLGDAIRGTQELQEGYAFQQAVHEKRAQLAKTKAEAQSWLTTVRDSCSKKEKKYVNMKGCLESILEDRKQLAQHYEYFKTLAIQADTDATPITVPIPELLQVCTGKFKKLQDYALTIYDWENADTTKALALLFFRSLLAYEAKIEQLRTQAQEVESTCTYLEEEETACLQSLDHIVEKRKQGTRDLQDIGGALHALAKKFPGLVSPTVLALYQDPSSLWASWWSYVPGSSCIIA